MTALLLPGETLTLGLNVIVRPGDFHIATLTGESYYEAPPEWVALTGPCPTCEGTALVYDREPDGEACPDCRDGRRIVPLYTEWRIGSSVEWSVVVIPPNPLVCPECGFVARRECGLGSHRYWKHGVPGKTYPPPRFGIVIDCVEVADAGV